MWCERVQLNSGINQTVKSSFAEERSNIFFLVQIRELSAPFCILHVSVFRRNQNEQSIRDFALVSEGRRSRGKHGRAKDNGYSLCSVSIVVKGYDI